MPKSFVSSPDPKVWAEEFAKAAKRHNWSKKDVRRVQMLEEWFGYAMRAAWKEGYARGRQDGLIPWPPEPR